MSKVEEAEGGERTTMIEVGRPDEFIRMEHVENVSHQVRDRTTTNRSA